MKVVIVEDEIKIRNGMRRLLEGTLGQEVAGTARNGREGLELIRRTEPDLVFTDIRMPEMDGLEMLGQLQAEGRHCHTVLLTGYADFEYAKQAVLLGADAYLLKPIDPEEVEQTIGRVQESIAREAVLFESTPDGYFKAWLFDTLEPAQRVPEHRSRVLQADASSGLWLLCVHGQSFVTEDPGPLERELRRMHLPEAAALAACHLPERGHLLLLFSTGGQEGGALLERLSARYQVFGKETGQIWVLQALTEDWNLREAAAHLDAQVLAASVVGGQMLYLYQEQAEAVRPAYVPPEEVTKGLLELIAAPSNQKREEWLSALERSIQEVPHDPETVRTALLQLSAVMAGEMPRLSPAKREQMARLESETKLRSSCTLQELLFCIRTQAETLTAKEEYRDDIRSYTIMRAIAYIREHYAQKISQEEVAASLSITPEYLSTLFHREMDVNFAAFVNQFRISHAKRLLRFSDLKVYEIAAQSGFSDTKYFNKVFRDQEGVSPGEYREQKTKAVR